MRGMWDKSTAVNRDYAPALDALKAVDHDTLTAALLAVVEHGCALMIGATRDKGAISLTLLDGNERHRVYPTDVQELHQALTDLVASLGGSAKVAPPAKSKR